jgi:hypothetical protein
MAKLITPVFRGSFVHLNEPKAPAAGAEPVYSIAIVLPKDDPTTKKFMKELKAVCDAKATEKFGQLPKKIKNPWKDGDEEDDRPEWAGAWVINAKAKSRPGVVMKNLKPVMDDELLYSGAQYRASISEWAWTHPTGGKGVSLNLDNVMWVGHGDRFDNRAAAEDDFSAFAEETEDDSGDDFEEAPAPKKTRAKKVAVVEEEDDEDAFA